MNEDAMTPKLEDVAQTCTRGSDEGSLTFPQVLGKLREAGVERYLADLVRGNKTYYSPDGRSCVVSGKPVGQTPAVAFDAAGIEAAIRASQACAIGYGEFCRRVVDAGCVGYVVSLAGRRAVYFGRTGETYVEPFPPAP
jgi:uncharacterized protein YbcV (DUF1398 family)